ncbi:MAG: hypothetical protein J7L38_00755 [Thermoproteales archaeon]|nr:hypothetical protein [Thermoproteales archaeon]
MSCIKPVEYYFTANVLVDEGVLQAKCRVKLSNLGAEPENTVQILLNRGLKASSVEQPGRRVIFTQRLCRFPDLKEIEVNLIEIHFERPLKPGGTTWITLAYEGEVEGYEEVFAYARDKIDENFSLIRTDVFSYPVVGAPEFKKLVSLLPSQRFNYRLEVTVPEGFKVANIGRLLGYRRKKDMVTYIYVSKLPSWRMDIAVARFKLLFDKEEDLRVFALEEDYAHAERIMHELKRCLAFYREWFGEPVFWAGYTVIEIPEGWGGQADVCGMLLDSRCFRDENEVGGLYHELAHLWNVPSGEKIPSRFLDEGFASYFQLLAERKFLGEEKFREKMKFSRRRIIQMAEKNPILLEIPVASYGEYMVTDASYFVGAWILYILHRIVGDEYFKKAIKRFLKHYSRKPATLGDFKETVVEVCGTRIEKFLDEWLFENKAITYLKKRVPLEHLLSAYKP